MTKTEKLLEWCLEKGKSKKRKHKGLKIIKPDNIKAKEHIEKAVHNLNFMNEIFKLNKYDDWIFPAAFYAMYHACLAVLYYFGFESRNQECTLIVTEKLIREKKIDLDIKYINSIRSIGRSLEETQSVKDLREEFQYGTKVEAEEEIVKNIKDIAEEFVLKVKGIILSLIGEV